MFNTLYALCLLVENYEKSFAFYHETLGLPVNSTDAKYADFKKDPDNTILEVTSE